MRQFIHRYNANIEKLEILHNIIVYKFYDRIKFGIPRS